MQLESLSDTVYNPVAVNLTPHDLVVVFPVTVCGTLGPVIFHLRAMGPLRDTSVSVTTSVVVAVVISALKIITGGPDGWATITVSCNTSIPPQPSISHLTI